MELKQCNEGCSEFNTCTNKLSDMCIEAEDFIGDMRYLLHEGYSEKAIRYFILTELSDNTSLVVDKSAEVIDEFLAETSSFEEDIENIKNYILDEIKVKGRLLLVIRYSETFKELGYTSFEEAIKQECGYTPELIDWYIEMFHKYSGKTADCFTKEDMKSYWEITSGDHYDNM